MLHDDAPEGRILTRRETLALLGSSSLFLLSRGALRAAAPATPGCIARPEQTEGPYFVDEALDRSDIRSDPADGSVTPGARLDLTLNVSRIAKGACVPLAGAIVDLWHCDALGVYSDVRDPHFDTTGKKFLRGFQATDTNGAARFTTIYPGWYPGRAVHIHFKVRTAPKKAAGTNSSRSCTSTRWSRTKRTRSRRTRPSPAAAGATRATASTAPAGRS